MYWIRRALVALVALALVAGIVWMIASRGSDPDIDTAASVTSSTPKLTGVLAPADTTTSPASSGATGTTDTTGATDATDTTGATDATGTTGATETGTSGTETADGSGATTAPQTSTPGTTTAAKTTAAKTTGKATDSESAATTLSTTPSTTASTTAAPPKTTPSTTAPPKPSYNDAGQLICADASLAVKATGWGFTVGSNPRVGMSVTNVGDKSCVRDLGGKLQVYTVYDASGAHVWSTADCFPGEGHAVRQLGPGQKANFVIVWSGTTSTPGCDTTRVDVKPGKYSLVAALDGIKSKPMTFTMR